MVGLLHVLLTPIVLHVENKMISEVDIRDWDRSIQAARKALGHPDQQQSLEFLDSFIDKVEALVYVKQPQVAALFKPTNYAKQRGEGTE